MDKKTARLKWEARFDACHKQQVENFQLIMGALAFQRDQIRGLRSDMATRLDNLDTSFESLEEHFKSRDKAQEEQWAILREALPDADVEEQLDEIRQRLDQLENPPAA